MRAAVSTGDICFLRRTATTVGPKTTLRSICRTYRPSIRSWNRNQWRLLEEQVRRWADRYDSIYVVTGGELEPGLRRIRGGTGIPRHYFKALLARAEKGWRAIAFRLPNVASPEGSWTDYSLSVDRLEELTGIDFFPALPDSIERHVESRVDAGFWK